MIVALHSAPKDFLKAKPPYGNRELRKLLQKAFSMGFKGFQVGPLWKFQRVDGERLKNLLDKFEMERNVHIGGLYDAEKLSRKDEEYSKILRELRCGILLCHQISSNLMSFHPPFSMNPHLDEETLRKARDLFLELTEKALDFASSRGIRLALESFCYLPFIFHGFDDFVNFVFQFPPSKLGVLMDVGHLYQAKMDLEEAIEKFKSRLCDVHIHDATRQNNFRVATHLPIGKGTIDFSRLIDSLHQVRYDGWLTLEIKGTEKEIVQSKTILENLMKS